MTWLDGQWQSMRVLVDGRWSLKSWVTSLWRWGSLCLFQTGRVDHSTYAKSVIHQRSTSFVHTRLGGHGLGESWPLWWSRTKCQCVSTSSLRPVRIDQIWSDSSGVSTVWDRLCCSVSFSVLLSTWGNIFKHLNFILDELWNEDSSAVLRML